ncbi:MAG: Rrf2 family transcriptional regulator [Anaerobutyricum soehngenii]
MRRAGLVKSIKGPQGGYLLAKSPESITVADVIYALDGSYLLEDERSVVSGADEKGISTAIQKLLIEQMNNQTDKLLNTVNIKNTGRFFYGVQSELDRKCITFRLKLDFKLVRLDKLDR